MNYYDFLNKVLSTNDGKDYAKQTIELSKTATNPYLGSVFNEEKDSAVKVDGVSIFNNAKKENFSKIDYTKILPEKEQDENADNETKTQEKLSPLEFVLKAFLTLDKVKELADKNKDGELTVQEVKNFVEKELAEKDGNIDDISLEDFEKVLQENNIDLEEVLAEEETEETTDDALTEDTAMNNGGYAADDVSYTPEVSSAAPAGYSEPAAAGSTEAQVTNDADNMTLEKLEEEKAARITTLNEKQAAVDNILSGNTESIKNAKAEADKAQAEYENAVKEDPGLKKFEKQILKNNENIKKNEENIDKNAKAIVDKESEISTAEDNLNSLKGELDALTSALSELPALSGKEEDKQKDNAIKAKKSEIEAQIKTKKNEVEKAEKQIEKLKKELEKLNKEKTKLEEEKTKLQEEKAELDANVEKYGSEVTKAKLEAFNKAKEKVEQVKTEALTKAKAELKTAQDNVKEINEKITAKKAEETKKQHSLTDESGIKPGLFKGQLAGKEEVVNQLCRKYGVSPALVASIIGLESGWGTSNLAQHNNFMGYRKAGDLGCNGKGFGYFSTPEKGLEAAIRNLAGYTRFSDVASVDFNNLDSIGRHYCDGQWAPAVRRMYNSTVQKYVA